MNNFNFTVIEGNLKEAPQFDGKQCRFLVDSTRSYTTKKGEKVESVQTFEIHSFGLLAKTCIKYLKKGARVLVSGTLRKSGTIYIEGKEVNFLSPAKEGV